MFLIKYCQNNCHHMNEVPYFAYGSNLGTSQMKERVGEWITSERVYVIGYKRVYNVWSSKNWKGWVANLKKTDVSSDKVCGVVYVITDEQLEKLTTKYEHKEPILISVRLENGQERNGVNAYIWMKEEPSHEPPTAYKDTIVKGLKQHGYSSDVIEKVKGEFSQS